MKKKIIGVLAIGAVIAGVAAIAKKVLDKEEDDFDGCDGDCESCSNYCMCEFDDEGYGDIEDDEPSDSTPAGDVSGE